MIWAKYFLDVICLFATWYSSAVLNGREVS
jgi:hypothetical protein